MCRLPSLVWRPANLLQQVVRAARVTRRRGRPWPWACGGEVVDPADLEMSAISIEKVELCLILW